MIIFYGLLVGFHIKLQNSLQYQNLEGEYRKAYGSVLDQQIDVSLFFKLVGSRLKIKTHHFVELDYCNLDIYIDIVM